MDGTSGGAAGLAPAGAAGPARHTAPDQPGSAAPALPGGAVTHDLSAGAEALAGAARCGERALASYRCAPGTTLRLLNVSENVTFLVADPDAGVSVLRVHRLGYHTEAAIASELAWLDALRGQAGVRVPRVLPACDGRRIVTAADDAAGVARPCVRFEFLPGAEPAATSAHFAALGEITARMHRHARGWTWPAGFTRFHWDTEAAFGPAARWGQWRDAPGAGPAERELLGRLAGTLRARLAAFGTGPDRYGLIHADTRLANLLVHQGDVSVIDFDDAGFGWYLYDAGTAVSFFEHEPVVPELLAAWQDGYRRVLPLPAADAAEIPTFVALRRLLLLAWLGTHRTVDIAARLADTYLAGTCELAESYLSGGGEPRS